MNVDHWLAELRRILFSYVLILMLCFSLSETTRLMGQGAKKIILPGIESELAKKQIAYDLGATSKII